MRFDPVAHTYEEKGIRFTPVSEFISKFKPEFPKEIIAAQTAKRDGRTAEDILAEWELNAEVSCEYGTAVHKAIEYWIRYRRFPKPPHLAQAVEKFAAKYAAAKLHPEIIVKRDDLRIAGTIDDLEMLGEKRVNIIDIKTGETNDTAKGKFLAPFQDLPFSKLNEHRLQLSAYKDMLELRGFTVEKLKLEHWNGEEFTTIEIQPINLTNAWQTITPR